MSKTSKPAKDQPVHQVRFGRIKAAVWKNDTDQGVRYNTTFARIYLDGETWKSTDSFGRDDLLLVAKAANEAHTWICQQQTQERDQAKGREEPED